jgi:nucleoside-diphosphate-sugar epimerase
MKHLVTGACGFVGSGIVKELSKRGHNVISVDVIDDPKIREISEFYKINILDKDNLSKIFKNVECVHHNAALVPLLKSGRKFHETNVIGTKNIIELSIKHEIKHISHMSSSAIFGKPESEKLNVNYSLYKPTGIYGKSKYLAELEILNNKNNLQKYNITHSIIRPRPILGEGRLGIFEILFDWVNDNKKIPIIGNGNNLFQFADLSDLVDVSIETSEKKISGIFNIGTDKFGTLKEDLNLFFEKVNSKSRVFPINKNLCIFSLALLDKLNLSPLTSWHYLSYSWNFYYDLQNTFKILAWRPKYSNVQMLCNSFYYYLSTKHKLKNNLSIHRSKIRQKLLAVIKSFL